MPCKIIIKDNITSVVEEKTNHALNQSLPIAQSIGNDVNTEFGMDVVSFSEENNKINRDINIPQELVDIYYDHEVFLEEEVPEILLQTEESVSSKASPETIAKIKVAAERMGIKMLELADYLKGNPEIKIGGINGLADLTQKTIAVAQGMEDVALTEEIVHVATAILEQTNPKLITELVAKIDRFKIYKTTLEGYKGNKNYQLANGKPDIRKIKKEAVDKLLAEVIINQSEGSTEFPELMEERDRNLVESWWNTILDYLRNLYKKTNIDIFHTAAQQILNQDIGTARDIEQGGVFFQIGTNPEVDKIYDTIINHDKELELNPETVNDKRHYTFQGERVSKSITQKIKEDSPFKAEDRTELQKIMDESKRDWGSKGHEYIEQYITNNLIDKDGYALETPNKISISTDLTYPQIQILKNFATSLINSYSPGTRFIVERKVVDTKVKGMLASTVDFVAIEPDVKTGFKIDTLDWKFTSINKDTAEDIPWYKQKEWKEQMGAYTKIWKNYGVDAKQIRKSRMVPFISNYYPVKVRDPKAGLRLTSIEVGDLNDLTKSELHLLPVPLNSESTDNPRIDSLLSQLRVQYEKLYKTPTGPEEKFAKDLRLNQISKAIRSLHLKLDFEPLVTIGNDFLDNAAKTLKGFQGLDYNTLTKEEVQDKLRNLLEYKASSEKFVTIDDVFLSQFGRTKLDDEGKKTLSKLEHISSRAGRMNDVIRELEKEYAVQLAIKEDITTKDSKNSILTPEAPVSWLSRTMLEGSKLPAKIINLASNLILNANNLANYKVAAKTDEFSKLLTPLEQEAKQRGKKAFDLIGKVNAKGLNLIKEFDKEFWDKISDAKETEDKDYLMSIINKETYNKLVKEYYDKNASEIMKTKFSSDFEVNEKTQEARLTKLKDSIDLTRKTFNGYKSFQFSHLLNQSIDEEKHYSKEFKEMRSSENAYKMWQFFTDLNKRAKDLGYLDNKRGLSFLPLIEASILQKFSSTEDVFKESADFFRDLYTVKINEQQAYSKVDPETGEVRKEIPKFFIKTDKAVNQLSTDLNRIGTLWIEALEKYETNKNLEATLEVLLSVEKAKGSLILGPDNNVMFTETGELKVNEKENKNADILQAIINDTLYGVQEDLNSLGNVKLSQVTGKFVKDEERKQEKVVSIKKGMNTADTLVKSLAVGLKPLIGIANWAGYQFQAFINNGDMYKFSEFEKNNLRISVGQGMSTLEKALLDSILPLNEDVSEEKRRAIAKEQGYLEYLSTFSFTDIMMLTNSFPERKLQFANAMSFIENTMVKDGKLVNIRQEVKRQDAKKKYAKDENGNLVMSNRERKELESTYESRVAALKEKESLNKVAKIEDGEIVIPGVSQEEKAKFRTKIIEYGRNLSGQMNVDNKAGFRRDSMLSSFMMFKGWIPKQVHVRTMDLRKNPELDTWEYGRSRAFLKTWAQLGLRNTLKMKDILNGTEEGLRIMDEMLAEKKAEHYKKTGQHLEITDEEFYDLMRTMLSNQFKELGMLFSVMALVLAAKAAEPPEDATELEKNRYKWWAKLTNKIADEVSFYYNPASTEAITRGSIIPALGLIVKAENAIEHLSREGYGHVVDDEEIIKDAHPLKYILNVIPGGYQFQTEVLPYIDPELAKEMGIRVTVESRRQ